MTAGTIGFDRMASGAGAGKAPMVEVVGIGKEYGGSQALHETSFSIGNGEFLALLGPSGSGKSTILNIISGMVRPSRGTVLIAGRDVTDVAPERRGIGMVFQNYALMPHMTVFENIAFPLRVRRVPGAEIRRRVQRVLELVRLPDIAGRKPRELSGGQQQRVSLARCIVYDPPLILMDEPLGALDKNLREHMQVELKRIHAELGVTILYVTHDQEEAMSMSDRIVLMNHGRIEQAGPPETLYDDPVSIFAARFVGQSNLLPAGVVRGGPAGEVRLDAGPVVPARCDGLDVGDRGKLLLRPEMLRLAPVTDERAAGLFGEVVEVLISGGVRRIFVRLADGSTVVAQELKDGDRPPFRAGERVALSWSAVPRLLRDGDAGTAGSAQG